MRLIDSCEGLVSLRRSLQDSHLLASTGSPLHRETKHLPQSPFSALQKLAAQNIISLLCCGPTRKARGKLLFIHFLNHHFNPTLVFFVWLSAFSISHQSTSYSKEHQMRPTKPTSPIREEHSQRKNLQSLRARTQQFPNNNIYHEVNHVIRDKRGNSITFIVENNVSMQDNSQERKCD